MEKSWETLEVRSIVNYARAGEAERMTAIETNLRMEREERECFLSILAEEEARSKRIEKMERLKKAWQLKVKAVRYQSMVLMMEGMSLQEMEMEMDWIESSIIERM